MNAPTYIGGELELFANAINWKSYWVGQTAQFLGKTVLEIGAGLGASTAAFSEVAKERGLHWTCLEPDPQLSEKIPQNTSSFSPPCKILGGTLAELSANEVWDSILYIDVLEHIEFDAAELSLAASHLSPGGRLIVLAPAHQYLFSPFDKSIGHFRRYNRESILAAAPASLKVVCCKYLDAIGFFASLANKLVLRKPLPSLKDILFWDRCLVPVSRVFDPLLAYRFGKSVLAVWEKA